ncbi:MAG: MoaD/ThiS family protein [Eubacteriales bacterium]
MNIEVRLFASFRNGRWKKKTISFNEGTKIKDVINSLKIDEEELGIVMVNGSYRKSDTLLKEGDVLSIFPPVAGG